MQICINTMPCVTLHLPSVVTKWLRPWLTTFWHFNRILHYNNNQNFLTMEIESFGNYSFGFWFEQKNMLFPLSFLSALHWATVYSFFISDKTIFYWFRKPVIHVILISQIHKKIGFLSDWLSLFLSVFLSPRLCALSLSPLV